MLRKFASLAYPTKYGYAYDTDAYDYKAPIDGHFRMFETYGDGLTQHSGDWSITQEYLTDYLGSLADVLINDEELLQRVSFQLSQRPSVEQIEFAASVVYQAPKDGVYGKTRYFSVSELKISSSSSKRHDKRYEEIRDIHDGTADSIYRILIPEYAHGLQYYLYATAIRDWVLAGGNKEKRPIMQLPGVFLNWFSDNDSARKLRDTYEACYALIQSHYQKNQAFSHLENYKRSLPKPEPTAAPETEISTSTESEVS